MKKPQNNFDEIIKQAVKEKGVSKPSHSFTGNVMLKLEKVPVAKAYKPLISQKVWYAAAFVVIALMVYAYKTNANFTFINDELIASKTTEFKSSLPKIPTFKLSSTMIYTLTIALSMILIQIPILKRMFDQQWKQPTF